jgi:hypothetical protein
MKSELNIEPASLDALFVDIPGGSITMRDDRIKEQWTVDKQVSKAEISSIFGKI